MTCRTAEAPWRGGRCRYRVHSASRSLCGAGKLRLTVTLFLRARAWSSHGWGSYSSWASPTQQVGRAAGQAGGASAPPGIIAGRRPTVRAGADRIEGSWEPPGKIGGVDADTLTCEVRYAPARTRSGRSASV